MTAYYVNSASGYDVDDGLTPISPFKTLTYAMKELAAGDTLYVMKGTYTALPSPLGSFQGYSSGTSGSPITVTPYLNELPIISATNEMYIEDISWWVFDGLTFQDSNIIHFGRYDSGITPNDEQCTKYADDIVVKNCKFQHYEKTACFKLRCSNRIDITDNLFDNIRSRSNGVDSHGILALYQNDDITISRNHFSDISGDGIQFEKPDGCAHTNILINNNEFRVIHPYTYRDTSGTVIPEATRPFDSVGENAIDLKMGPGPIVIEKNIMHGFRPTLSVQDASGAGGEAIIVQQFTTGVQISKNYFYDNSRHILIGSGTGLDYNLRDVVINNNIVKEAIAHSGIYSGASSRVNSLQLEKVDGVDIYNNTFTRTTDNLEDLIYFTYIRNVNLYNNIFKYGKVSSGHIGDFGLTNNNNAWSEINGTKHSDFIGANDITSDDLNLSGTWKPLTGSPLIDAGVNVGLTDDYYGDPIYNSIPDIGAGEYQGAVSVTNNNIRILNGNLANDATLAASSEAGSLVVDNLKTDLKSEVWRSTSKASETITVTFSEDQTVGIVAFPFCNFTSSATMRVRLYDTVGTNLVHDSGTISCCDYANNNNFEWGNTTFGVNSFNYSGAVYASVWVPQTDCDKVVIDITDPANSATYLEAGSLAIGSYWSPEYNIDYGFTVAQNDTTKTKRNDAGDSVSSRGNIHKVLSMNLSLIPDIDRDAVLEMIRVHGTSKPVFISVYPDNEDTTLEQSGLIYGKLVNSSVSHSYYQTYSSKIQIEEI